MLEVRFLIAIILNLKGYFQSEYNKYQNAFWGTWVIFFCPHPPSMFRPRRPKCFSWSGFHFSHSERRKAEAERDVEALLVVGKLVSGGWITTRDASSRQIPPKVVFFKKSFLHPPLQVEASTSGDALRVLGKAQSDDAARGGTHNWRPAAFLLPRYSYSPPTNIPLKSNQHPRVSDLKHLMMKWKVSWGRIE